MPDVQEAAEQATFWVSFGQAAGLVGMTAAATAVGAFIATKAIQDVDPAMYDDVGGAPGGQRRRRMSLDQAEQIQQQQPEQQPAEHDQQAADQQ